MLFRSNRGRVLWVLILGLALAGCRCGKKPGEAPDAAVAAAPESTVSKLPAAAQGRVLNVLPPGARWLGYSNEPPQLWHWLEGRPLFAALRKTYLWQDLAGSEPGMLLATLRQRLNRLSRVSLGNWSLESLSAAPLVVAGYPPAKGQSGTRYLLVKAVDLRLQALDRLAESLNQVAGDDKTLGSFEWEGTTVRTISLGGKQAIFYSVFSNLLLLSNSRPLFLEALALAAGKSQKNLLGEGELLAGLAGQAGQHRLLLWVDLGVLDESQAFWHWSPGLWPGRELALTLDQGSDDAALHSGPLPSGRDSGTVDRQLLGLLPEHTRLVVASTLVDLQAAGKPGKGAAVPGPLRTFRGQAAVAWAGLELRDDRPLVHGAVLLKPAQGRWTPEQAGSLAKFLLAAEPERGRGEAGPYWRAAALAGEPTLGLLGDWLVVASTKTMFDQLVACAQGKGPSLAGWSLDAGRLQAARALAVVDAKSLAEDLAKVADWRAQALGRQRDWHQVLDPVLGWAGSLGRRALLLGVSSKILSGSWQTVAGGG